MMKTMAADDTNRKNGRRKFSGKPRKKLHAPVKWSDSKWESLCGEIAELAAKVPEAGATLPNSPVADY